ncbi:MAG: FAD-dependent oxidoreductase [Clostridia bacterium]|nr:FAD-dependent oxidoreductase [Clostridia bacterium]
MKSIWSEKVDMPTFNAPEGDKRYDVLIIGGGIAGILTAYMLKKKGVSYALIEADRICGRTTANTTAKITAQHALIYEKIINGFGTQVAKKYYEINSRAIFEYRRLAENIECDFKDESAFVYSCTSRDKLEREARAYEKAGIPFKFHESLNLPISVAGALEMENQAQFHPLKFISSLAKDLNIFENTRALKISGGTVITNRGNFFAERIIVATHFPFINSHGLYFMKMYQERSYVMALEGAEDVFGMYIDEKKGGFSFRNHEGLLLLGCGGHRTGEKNESLKTLADFKEKYYKNSTVKEEWATQDCITLDGIPYVGRYSALSPNLFVATGFNKWGMTSSMSAALILADLVTDRENEYASIFSPSRSIFNKSLLSNIKESAKGLITFKAPRCPHLGCALKYNKSEHSWDCPCHGSRFTEDGALIDNPANKDKPSLQNEGGSHA